MTTQKNMIYNPNQLLLQSQLSKKNQRKKVKKVPKERKEKKKKIETFENTIITLLGAEEA
jgi:hypothetical protein